MIRSISTFVAAAASRKKAVVVGRMTGEEGLLLARRGALLRFAHPHRPNRCYSPLSAAAAAAAAPALGASQTTGVRNRQHWWSGNRRSSGEPPRIPPAAAGAAAATGGAVAAAAAAMLAADASLQDGNDGTTRTTTMTQSEAAAATSAKSFKAESSEAALKEGGDHHPPKELRDLGDALQAYQERQKVKLGRLLRQFQELAALQEEEGEGEGERQPPGPAGVAEEGAVVPASGHDSNNDGGRSESETSVGGASAAAAAAPKRIVRIDEEDLTDLRTTPERAWHYIDRMMNDKEEDDDGGVLIDREDVKRIAYAASEVLRREPTLNDLSGRNGELRTVTVVGDLHGHYGSLRKVLDLLGADGRLKGDAAPGVGGGDDDKRRGRFGSWRKVLNLLGMGKTGADKAGDFGTPWDGTGAVVFNGDFVDRGDHSLEVFLSLLLLKLAYPDHIYLNRGNHEDSVLSTVYGYSEELQQRYSKVDVDDIWEAFGDVFASLPLAVKTRHAAIIHGGLPSGVFKLDELAKISSRRRFRIKTMLEPEPDDHVCKLFQNLTWSDPGPDNGIEPNVDRGVGMKFGPDVLQTFLTNHDLKYLVRSHEPVDDGYELLELPDEDVSAVTVFSAAGYPNGEGFNYGAVVRLNSDGTSQGIAFEESSAVEKEKKLGRTFKGMANLIAQNRTMLENEFMYFAERNALRQRLQTAYTPSAAAASASAAEEEVQAVSPAKDRDRPPPQPTAITPKQWAYVCSYVLGLYNVDWESLQPYLAPTTEQSSYAEDQGDQSNNASASEGMIDYRRFLDLHCNLTTSSFSSTLKDTDVHTLEVLQRNHDALITVFSFLDTDNDGHISREEFRRGIVMLADRNADHALLRDVDSLFDTLDLDGNGTIELEEFRKSFQAVDVPYHVAILMLFDKDHDSRVSREEFREGVRLLNARLAGGGKSSKHTKTQITNVDELFDSLDLNGDGELDVEEFESFVREYYPH